MKLKQQPIQSDFNYRSTASEVIAGHDLHGKTMIVTGGYSGVGLAAVQAFSQAGATVIVPARHLEKARRATAGLPNIELGVLDLMDPASIDAFAASFLATNRPLDYLVNSAGIMFGPLRRDAQGNEAQFSTNYLGHFQLIAKLYTALKAAHGARVVTLSSRAQSWNGVQFADINFENSPYDDHRAYAQSKSADVLLTVELDRRAQKDGIRAFAVHPGLVPGTNLGARSTTHQSAYQRFIGLFNHLDVVRLINAWNHFKQIVTHDVDYNYFKSVPQGAATTVWAVVSEELKNHGGVYLEDCNIAPLVSAESHARHGVWPWAVDPHDAVKLWQIGEKMTGVSFLDTVTN